MLLFVQTEVFRLMRRGQAVGRVVGHGHHHDEYGCAAFFGAREFFFGITEHEFVGDAPCVGFCFGIVGFEGVFIDDFVDAKCRKKVSKSRQPPLPAVI